MEWHIAEAVNTGAEFGEILEAIEVGIEFGEVEPLYLRGLLWKLLTIYMKVNVEFLKLSRNFFGLFWFLFKFLSHLFIHPFF